MREGHLILAGNLAGRGRDEGRGQETDCGGLTGRLEHEGEGVASVLGLEGDDVVVSGALEHLGDGREVEAEGDGAVAAVVLKALAAHQERHE